MRILGTTSIRSDYDLMSGIYKSLNASESIDFKLLVSGAHLSNTFGLTIAEIYRDKLPILAEIETLLDSDSTTSRIKTASLLLQNSLHSIRAFAPDVIIFAGDREDALVLASIGAYLKIPTVHFFGGDHASDGNVDNPVRHAISKLVTSHFVMHATHRQRLIRIGESSNRIFIVGNPALDRFRTEPNLKRKELFNQIGAKSFSADSKYAVLIHHPVLGSENQAATEVETILQVLQAKQIPTFINVPNTDAGSRQIMRVYEMYKKQTGVHFLRSLPRNQFINLLRHATFLIGNSSLGLLEASSIPLGVINVGVRQRGRLATENVIFVDATRSAVEQAIEQVHSAKFLQKLAPVRNPYGDGHSVDRVVKLLQTIDFQSLLYKREDPLEIPYI